GMVTYVGSDPIRSKEKIELGSKYILPGFINAHMHIESSMMIPSQFGRVVIPRGTTCVIADAHEIANVKGIEGMKFMLRDSRRTPLKAYFMIPSCVPATHLETSGAEISVGEIKKLRRLKGIIGLGEFMDFPGVIAKKKDDLEKISTCEGMPIDGHAPGLRGRDLCTYISAGILSDHECTTKEEALEKLSLGMWIMIREGTAEKNLSELIKIVSKKNSRHFMFVTDDKDVGDLLVEGDVNYNLKKAVGEGLDPIEAIRMVTLNPAEHYCLRHLGGVSPGKCADIVVMDNLKDFNADLVIIDGNLVAKNGRYLLKVKETSIERSIQETMNLREIRPEDLAISYAKGKERVTVRVIGAIESQIYTKALKHDLCVEGGQLSSDAENDVIKICVVERHKNSGRIGKGFVKGFGLKGGAIASSVAHDSHNIITVGTDDKDMCMAVNKLREMRGGIIAVNNEKILEELPLPVAGLMSTWKAEEIVVNLKRLHEEVAKLGCSLSSPFMTLSFLALPVIPELKLTDYGLVDVEKFDFVPLVLE
ncbi:MAG: adenine deaminase, partial [Candidatus Methylarchaceae archaeon HK02M1]|nr:adenine deaminase [Candidatus Methylarchaceae archaeon HK02M1]